MKNSTQKFWTIRDLSTVKTSEIITEAKTLFPNIYIWEEKDIDTQFPAPAESIEVSFLADIESDKEHKGKSYNDFIAEKDKSYMTMRQYLLLAIHVFKTTGEHLDVKGWTRTSSLWRGGFLVCGCWDPGDGGVCLDGGRRDGRYSDGGPREQFNLKTLPFNASKKTKESKASDTTISEALSIEKAIEMVKDAGYQVSKIM